MTTKPPTSPVVIPDMGDRIFGQDAVVTHGVLRRRIVVVGGVVVIGGVVIVDCVIVVDCIIVVGRVVIVRGVLVVEDAVPGTGDERRKEKQQQVGSADPVHAATLLVGHEEGIEATTNAIVLLAPTSGVAAPTKPAASISSRSRRLLTMWTRGAFPTQRITLRMGRYGT
jgi:hypothetical protein